jgi:hypothetical protein
LDQCNPPGYAYSATGPIVSGTTPGMAITDPDSADGQPCSTGGGQVMQYTTEVYFPAGDGPLSGSSSSNPNYGAVFAVKASGALAGNTYFQVQFASDNSSFTWQECVGGSAATGIPAGIAVLDENNAYSNNDCVPQ